MDEDEAMVGSEVDPMAKLGAAKLTEVTARRDRYNTVSAREGQAFGLALSLHDSPQRSLSPEPTKPNSTANTPTTTGEARESRVSEEQLGRLIREAEQHERFAEINNTADAQKYLSGLKPGTYIIRRTAQRLSDLSSFFPEFSSRVSNLASVSFWLALFGVVNRWATGSSTLLIRPQ